MPFITEEIWHLLRERAEGDDIIIAQIPVFKGFDDKIIASFERAEQVINGIRNIEQVINGIRNIRKDKNIPNKESIELGQKHSE